MPKWIFQKTSTDQQGGCLLCWNSKTSLWAVWAEQQVQYTWFQPQTSQEGNKCSTIQSLLCMIKVVDVYNQRFLHIFFIAYQTNWFDFSKLDALEAPNLHEKLLISVPSNYHAICELWKLRRIFIELSQMIYFEFKSFLKKHYCFYSTALSRDKKEIQNGRLKEVIFQLSQFSIFFDKNFMDWSLGW